MPDRKLFARRAATCALVSQLFGLCSFGALPSTAIAQESPLVAAGTAYREGEFAECVRLIDVALAAGSLAASERVGAFEYLGRACARLGNEVRAVESFGKLLDLNPAWRPDSGRMPPNEIALFERALEARRTTPESKQRPTPAAPVPGEAPKLQPPPIENTPAAGAGLVRPRARSRLFWVLGGVSAAVAVALLSNGGGSQAVAAAPAPGPLPGAPSLPSRP